MAEPTGIEDKMVLEDVREAGRPDEKCDQRLETLSVDSAAAVLGVSRSTLYESIRRDPGFPVLKLGRNRLLIPRAGFLEWMETGGQMRSAKADPAAIARELHRATLKTQLATLRAQAAVVQHELNSLDDEDTRRKL